MTLVAQVTPHFNGFWTKQYLVRIEVTSLRRGQDGRNTPNKDSMFGFGFDDDNKIILIRGAKKVRNFTKKLLRENLDKIKKKLNPKNLIH